jgi:hypothetical protein
VGEGWASLSLSSINVNETQLEDPSSGMASEQSKVARMTRPERERKLAEIARQPDGAPLTDSEAGPAEVELALTDLIGDDNGEIVLFNDSGLRSLAIRTEAALVANGRVQAHVTAAGEDVSGFRFVRLDNGLTLYFQEGLDLVLASGAA